MKRFLLIIAALAALSSCTKDFSGAQRGNESFAAPERICSGGCPVSDLVHHPAKEPCYSEPGNNEFWQCPHCRTIYSDPAAENRFEGMVYMLPTRIIRGERNLRILAGDYSAGTKGPISKAITEKATEIALGATVAALIVSITTLAVSIEELCTNNDEIEESLTKLSGKIDKTAEEVREMKVKVAELQNSVAQTGDLMNTMASQVDSLYSYLDSLVEYSRSVEHTADVIFDEIESMDEDFHYRKILDDRHHDLSAITDPCVGAVNAIRKCLSTDLSYLESSKDCMDSLSVIRLCLMDVNNIVSAWGSDKGNYAATACSLIQTYPKMSNNCWETFPSVLESYINNHIIWEHQGYVFRVKSLVTDLVITTTAYYLAQSYFRNCSGWDRSYVDLKCKALESDYNSMVSLYDSAIDKINRADSLYRRCMINGKSFDVLMKINTDAVTDYFNYLEKEYGSANVIPEFEKHQEVMFRADETNCFSYEDWEWMLSACYAPEKDFKSVLLTYDNGGMGFRMDWDGYFNGIIFPYSDFGRMDCQDYDDRTYVFFSYYNHLGEVGYDSSCYLVFDGTTTTIGYYAPHPYAFIFPYTENTL